VDEVRVYDAGKFYIKGPGFLRPIQWRWHRLERDQIRQAVADREAAGRPWFDHDSLAEADLLDVICRDGGASSTTADRLDGLDDPRAGTVAALLRLFDSRGSDWLPTSLIVGAGVATDATELQADLAGLVRGAVSTREGGSARSRNKPPPPFLPRPVPRPDPDQGPSRPRPEAVRREVSVRRWDALWTGVGRAPDALWTPY
jgi:hypothetical protein